MSQNINQFPKPNWGVKLALDVSDMTLSTDERNYKEEVVFSPYLIAETYGNRLPINFDINDSIWKPLWYRCQVFVSLIRQHFDIVDIPSP